MASKRDQSAFNLLQIYQDDDDDMEDADIDDDDNDQRDPDPQRREQDYESNPNDDVLPNAASPTVSPTRQLSANTTPNWSNLTPQMSQNSAPEMALDVPQSRIEKPSIVDYGHDDVAMSPEPEEGEILGTNSGQLIFGEVGSKNERTPTGNVLAMTSDYQVDFIQSYVRADLLEADMMSSTMRESDIEVKGKVNNFDEDAKEVDPLDKFLPSPPLEKCQDELQEKINKFLAYKRQGKIFNIEVRNRKDYRNPDLLRHAVRYQEIDEIGSNFSKDVFDPHGYDDSDYYDAIGGVQFLEEADIELEMERKKQERRKNQKTEFASGGTQTGITTAVQKVTLPSPSVPGLPSGVLQSGSTDALTRKGRQNKESKWDKVDGDKRNLSSGGQDAVSAVGAHAVLLSSANAGAGYAMFVRQKRREADEKRSSDMAER